ncbi:MAG: hypothetical protein Q8M37_12745 [Nevskia sp.]|nr:hypothetical protein [Nevskia sp.]
MESKLEINVIPAKAGIQFFVPSVARKAKLDARLRGHDDVF